MAIGKEQNGSYTNYAKEDDAEINLEYLNVTSHPTQSSSTTLPDLTMRTIRGPLAPLNNFLDSIEVAAKTFISNHKKVIQCLSYFLLLTGFLAYFIAACIKNSERARVLVYITAFALFCIAYWFIKKYFGDFIWKNMIEPIHTHFICRYRKVINWTGIILLVSFLLFWIIYDTSKNPKRLISLSGFSIFVFIGFITSRNRSQIRWRPVIGGFTLQFMFGLVILRTSIGYQIFRWVGGVVSKFLSFSSAGSTLLFGDLPQFAFTVLPLITYFAAFTYVLYYLGVIQVIISKISWLLETFLGTSPAESFNAAGNIFVGQTEAPLLIRPFLEDMTDSEIHAVMTGGFATIAGSVFAAYVSFGISAHHLLTASVMSAPAALAMSKLMCPETEEQQVKVSVNSKVGKTEERNIFEAVSVGASLSIGLLANIAVMLIAFISLLKSMNSLLGWLGSLVDEPNFSFEFVCSYVFMPLAYVMGVPWEDSFKVAELLGVKTFINEFVAYQRFSVYLKNKAEGSGDTLTARSEIITIYALCGFANFGSMGIQLGGLSALVPSKKGAVSKLVFRALCAGTMACFTTACLTGILYDIDEDISHKLTGNMTTDLNETISTTFHMIAHNL